MKYNDFNEFKAVVQSIIKEMFINYEIINQCLNCKRILYMKLSEVNVLPNNRSGSKSKQTHIHISGKNMSIFYTLEELEEARLKRKSTYDEKLNIYLIDRNIQYLKEHGNNDSVLEFENTRDSFIKTYTYKKNIYQIRWERASTS